MADRPHVAVVGAGAWGTALAGLVAGNGRAVSLLTRRAGEADRLNAERSHPGLAGVELAPEITATGDGADIAGADIVVLATPAQHLADVASHLASRLDRAIPVVIAAKGVERATGRLMHEIVAETLPRAVPAVLSGPGFAADVAAGLPTAVTLACADAVTGEALVRAFARPAFRPYLSGDLIGAELGGALKNVLAIAAGIVVGRRLGESARAALIARGLAEMTRFGVAMGGERETFFGLSGLGDLVLTATSPRSRNTALGMALGAGTPLADLTGPGAPLAEGLWTAGIVADLAIQRGIDVPITASVAGVVAGTVGIDDAIASLLERPLGRE